MAKRFNAHFADENKTSKVIIIKKDGTQSSTSYGAILANRKEQQNKGKKKRKAKTLSYAKFMKEYSISLLKPYKVVKSLLAYTNNGYRQWGTICRDNIINNPMLSGKFAIFRIKCNEMDAQLQLIENEKEDANIWQLIEKLSFIFDDVSKAMNALAVAINESRVCEFYQNHEMINGEHRRLGLSKITCNAMLALAQMQKTFQEINQISINGEDIGNIKENGSFNRF